MVPAVTSACWDAQAAARILTLARAGTSAGGGGPAWSSGTRNTAPSHPTVATYGTPRRRELSMRSGARDAKRAEVGFGVGFTSGASRAKARMCRCTLRSAIFGLRLDCSFCYGTHA